MIVYGLVTIKMSFIQSVKMSRVFLRLPAFREKMVNLSQIQYFSISYFRRQEKENLYIDL